MRYKSFVINVASNDFRRDHVLAQAEKSGLDLTIFDAITPHTMDMELLSYDDGLARRFTGRGMLPTELACALSHITLWRQLLKDSDADYYVILEDDITFETNIAQLLEKLDTNTIDFLKLSGKQNRPKKKISNIENDYSVYQFAYGPLDTAAYVISKRCAKTMIDHCKNVKTPIDILMDRSYEHGIPVYGIMPYPVTADFCFDPNSPFYSTIGERKKYADDIKLTEKLSVKYQRIWGGILRKIATLKLRLARK